MTPPRVLITGATGFIGSHLVECLAGEELVMGLLLRPESNRWRIPRLPPDGSILTADLTDYSSVTASVQEFAPDAVIHLAWFGVENEWRDDPRQLEQNLPPTLALFDAARRAGVRTWIGLGSQAEYGPRNEPIDETAPTTPTTLYGVAKLAVCQQTRRLAATAGMRWSWLRVFSAYGPKDNPSWMIPYLILSLLRGERPSLTAGEQMWDYVHVRDVAGAIAAVLRSESAEGVFNVGSGQARQLRTIVEDIRDRIDPRLPLGFGEVPYRPDQVMHLEADITRLTQVTGWLPRVDMDSGLTETVDWYRDHRSRFDS